MNTTPKFKLYQDDGSPFASRVRLQAYYKDLPVTLCAPPGGPRSEEYRAINPLGLIPALQTPDGVLSESVAIMEYLEDRFPEPPMRPSDPFARAEARRMMLYHDARVQPALAQMFRLLMSGKSDPDAAAESAKATREALVRLEVLLPPDRPASELTLPDCVLVPTHYFTDLLTRMLGCDSVLDTLPGIEQWWERTAEQPAVFRVIGEIEAAMAALAKKTGGG